MRMVDLIRAQQKEKKATPRPAKSAPAKVEPEPQLESGAQISEPPKKTWKASLALVSPPPEEPPIFVPERSSPGELYAAADECLRAIFNAARRREPFAIEPAAEMAEQFAHATAKEDLRWTMNESLVRFRTLMQQTLNNIPESPDLVRHGLNVAIYAVQIGNVLDYPLTKLKELALAGMFHDIGMTRLPETLLSKPGPLSKSDWVLVHKHPIYGHDIPRGLGPDWEWLAEVILQHHEREDGTGYPNGLRGEHIHEHSQIIGICEIYESMRYKRQDRGAFAPFDAMKHILQIERTRFSQAILKAFINGMSSYPVGSWVRLSTKEIAWVIATNKANPLRPVLEVWADASGEKLPQPRLLDLNKEILLHIIGPAAEDTPTG